jgi:prolyl-tRNA synthetase
VHTGKKTESEKFAGAESTYTIEALMRDGKALQAGTSHNLGQNFAKAFDTKFTNEKNELEFTYQTSWGVSTRLVGAVVMGHHDEIGLILPPAIAPYPVVIIPILIRNKDNSAALNASKQIQQELEQLGIRCKLDDRENITQGIKFNEYEQKGVPVRLVIGPKDLEQGFVEIHRRDIRSKEKEIPREGIAQRLKLLLDEIQNNLFKRACDFRESLSFTAETIDEIGEKLNSSGGFVRCMWNGDTQLEEILKERFKATIRCIPDEKKLDKNKYPCVISGQLSDNNIEILVAKAY